MKAWKMYRMESNAKMVPCLDSFERLFAPYFEKMMAVVNRAMIPDNPRNYPIR